MSHYFRERCVKMSHRAEFMVRGCYDAWNRLFRLRKSIFYSSLSKKSVKPILVFLFDRFSIKINCTVEQAKIIINIQINPNPNHLGKDNAFQIRITQRKIENTSDFRDLEKLYVCSYPNFGSLICLHLFHFCVVHPFSFSDRTSVKSCNSLRIEGNAVKKR